jgi:hypothetical protein
MTFDTGHIRFQKIASSNKTSDFAMEPRPTSNDLPADLLILVGKIAIQSAYMDMLLGEMLGGLKNVTGAERAKTVHILDTRRKVQEAEDIVNAVVKDPERQSLLKLLERSGELLADRNLALHGVIAYHHNQGPKDPLYVAFRGKYVGKPVPFSKDTLEPIFKDLDDLSRDLMAECVKRRFSEYVPSP